MTVPVDCQERLTGQLEKSATELKEFIDQIHH
jgi:hypothetical protein